jgi:hypothetical protein
MRRTIISSGLSNRQVPTMEESMAGLFQLHVERSYQQHAQIKVTAQISYSPSTPLSNDCCSNELVLLAQGRSP